MAKLIPQFNDFLKDIVNLNKTRVEVATKSIETMTSFLENDDVFGDKFIKTSPQGSFLQETIIKPVNEDDEFDVDLLFEMEVVENWTAADYLTNLAAQFNASDRYKDKVDTKGKNRCVTIDYESDFHIDIVPTVLGGNGYLIMNKQTDEFEDTDGEGYARWFADKNEVTTKKHLTKVVRLFKYIRDYHQGFEAKSILLTTLLGEQVYDDDDSELYPDIPTTLVVIINRLNDFLQDNPDMPDVNNPVLKDENFNRHWDQEKYEEFRDQIKNYAVLVNDAYNEPDEQISLEKWQKVLGEDFVTVDAAAEKSIVSSATNFVLGSVAHIRPVTDISNGEKLQYRVKIDGYLYDSSAKKKYRGINSESKFASGLAIKYIAKTNAPKPYEVRWQVVNTGDHAMQSKGLRGSFQEATSLSGRPTSNPLVNWEFSQYSGKHWIECFIIKGGYCVARSNPFYVNIKNPNF